MYMYIIVQCTCTSISTKLILCCNIETNDLLRLSKPRSKKALEGHRSIKLSCALNVQALSLCRLLMCCFSLVGLPQEAGLRTIKKVPEQEVQNRDWSPTPNDRIDGRRSWDQAYTKIQGFQDPGIRDCKSQRRLPFRHKFMVTQRISAPKHQVGLRVKLFYFVNTF